MASGPEDIDIQEAYLLDQFNKYSKTKIVLWKRFECNDSEEVLNKFKDHVDDAIRYNNGYYKYQRDDHWWIKATVDRIRLALGNAGADTRRVLQYN